MVGNLTEPLLKNREKALLIFVDGYDNYAIFEMIDGFMV